VSDRRASGVTDKVAIVTGACSGIGLAMTLGLAARGARVVAADIGDAAAEFEQLGDAVLYVAANVTEPDDHRRVVDECTKAFGRIDALFNNAGVTRAGPIHLMSEENWDLVLDVDLRAVFLGCKAVLPVMIEQGGGAIVNTASTLGTIANHHLGAYTAAKHGVIGLTKQLGLDYGRYGIRTNCICPGPTLTPNVARSYGGSGSLTGRGQYLLDSVPLGRMADPSEIASAAIFLASDEASFVNGATLVVDGGHSVHTGPTWTADLFDEGP
jgi:NAD(P)-dependent dehydrogenase (short-subunit alcohol dehydrogenase family)